MDHIQLKQGRVLRLNLPYHLSITCTYLNSQLPGIPDPLAFYQDYLLLVSWRRQLMAGLANERGDYAGKITWFVVMSCMMAAVGGILFGYDIGISGGVSSMESFLKKFFPSVYTKMENDTKISNYCKFDSQLLTVFTSSLYAAGIVASFFASSITRSYGRKPTILAGGISFLVGSAIGGAALDVYMLIIARLLLGIGVGFANQSIPLYLSEMAPMNYRGAFNTGYQVTLDLGILFAGLVNYGSQKIKSGWGWRLSLALAAAPAFVLTLGALFLPDTPNSLIQRTNDQEKAKVMLQKIRGTMDVQEELDDIIEASRASTVTENSFKEIPKRKYRPQLAMAIALPFFQQLTGINVIGFYAPILFRTLGFAESASLLSTVLSGVVGTASTVIAMLVVDKFGRRALFMFGGIQMLVSHLIIGIILALHLKDHGDLEKGYAYFVLVLVYIFAAGFGLSWGPLGWLVPSEIFQMEIRSAGMSIFVAVSFFFTFAVAQTFLAMLCSFKSGIFFFFGAWVALMTAFVYWLLPETGNIPIEKMDQIWKDHWFWSKFVVD
ncbi:Hexose carrier protein HEX6-like protein [Drosera capensis]